MNVYHKVLHKLCETTDGKTSKAVDLKDLVKKLGFNASYPEIFGFLSGEGWIAESPKADFVFLTHWGVAEVKKASSPADEDSDSSDSAKLKKEADRALTASRELTGLIEKFVQKAQIDDFAPIEKKFAELQNILNQIKKN